jgi:chemotaxis protein MotB
MARRAVYDEEIASQDRWLISYADLITLLFAFFVVMYAVSSVNDGKYRVLSESLVAAFRSPQSSLQPIQVGRLVRSPYRESAAVQESPVVIVPSRIPLPVHPLARAGIRFPAPRPVAPDSKVPAVSNEPEPQSAPLEPPPLPMPSVPAPLPQEPVASPPGPDPLLELADLIRAALGELVAIDQVEVRAGRLAVEVEIRNKLLFDSASASISDSAAPLLAKAASVLREIPNRIRVEGHTDDMPINSELFPSNWELSAARAASVVYLLSRQGVGPERLAAVGRGEHHPLDVNSTEEGRARNRRVTIIVLADSALDEGALEAVGVETERAEQ